MYPAVTIDPAPVVFSKGAYHKALSKLEAPDTASAIKAFVFLDLRVAQMQDDVLQCEGIAERVQELSGLFAAVQKETCEKSQLLDCLREVRESFDEPDLHELALRLLGLCSARSLDLASSEKWLEESQVCALRLEARVAYSGEFLDYDELIEGVPSQLQGKVHTAFIKFQTSMGILEVCATQLDELNGRLKELRSELGDYLPQIEWLSSEIIPIIHDYALENGI